MVSRKDLDTKRGKGYEQLLMPNTMTPHKQDTEGGLKLQNSSNDDTIGQR